ncbi:MFS transporter [Candidatus Gottesmanbacteria bacterium]|nr:MFS transporter [Candidatus Gottesmanbacteria bacterium]
MIKFNLPPVVQVLKIRPFLFLWMGQVASQISVNMMNFVLLLHIAQKTNSNTADAVFILAVTLPAVVFGPLAGVYADRSEKKRVLFVCNLLRAALALVFIISSEELFVLYLLAVLASIVTQFFVPAEAPLIPNLVPKNLLLSANGLFNLTFYAAIVLGFMFAGPAIAAWGVRNTLVLIWLIFLAATIFIGLLPGSNPLRTLLNLFRTKMARISFTRQNTLSLVIKDYQEGITYLRNNPHITEALLLLAMAQVAISTLLALAPGYAATVLRINITDSSLVMVAPAILGMVVGSLGIGFMANKINKNKIINGTILLAGVVLSLLSFLSRGKLRTEINFQYIFKIDIVHLAIILFFFLGILNSFLTVLANTKLQEETEESIRSRIYGFLTAASGIGGALPVLLSGILSDIFGVVKIMFGIGLVILAFGSLKIAKSQRLI